MSWIRSSWRLLLALIVVWAAVVVVGLMFLNPLTQTVQCDGSVPTWMIPDDYDQSGCVRILEGAPPADWDGRWVCIGLCDSLNPSPYYPDA